MSVNAPVAEVGEAGAAWSPEQVHHLTLLNDLAPFVIQVLCQLLHAKMSVGESYLVQTTPHTSSAMLCSVFDC